MAAWSDERLKAYLEKMKASTEAMNQRLVELRSERMAAYGTDDPAAQRRLMLRLAGRTKCRCGGEATCYMVGPPGEWLCVACRDVEIEALRLAAAQFARLR